MDNEFPPNSNEEPRRKKKREVEAPPEKVVSKVTRGKVVRRKKPLYRQFFDAFRPEDNKGFVEYVVLDMFVPSLKDAVADASTAAIDQALGVNNRSRSGSRRRRGDSGGSRTEYNRMSGPDRDRGRGRRESGARMDPMEIVVDDRIEANEVLDQMYELLSKFEVVSVRDMLSIVGLEHNFTDENWGWTDLGGSRVQRVNGGYLIDLPRAIHLD